MIHLLAHQKPGQTRGNNAPKRPICIGDKRVTHVTFLAKAESSIDSSVSKHLKRILGDTRSSSREVRIRVPVFSCSLFW